MFTKACLICGAQIRVLGEEELFNSDLCCNDCVAFLGATEKSPWGQRRSLTTSREKRKWSEKKRGSTRPCLPCDRLYVRGKPGCSDVIEVRARSETSTLSICIPKAKIEQSRQPSEKGSLNQLLSGRGDPGVFETRGGEVAEPLLLFTSSALRRTHKGMRGSWGFPLCLLRSLHIWCGNTFGTRHSIWLT